MKTKCALFSASMLGGLVAAASAVASPVLPTGGVVKAGSVSIGAPAGGSLVVNQTSSKAIVDWSSFSIGQGGAVKFDNGAGATLNRVTGADISSIDGLLSATGSVYLINPNGVIIGKTGVVNTGGSFVASTLDVGNSSFLAGGPLTFSGPSTAGVVNLGKVSSLGGNVAMIAATVSNAGAIAAPKGDVGLIAGTTVTMDDADNDAGGLFSVQVGDGSTSATNTGAITAAAVELRAQQGNVYALAGNAGGVINATGINASGGVIKLISTGGATQVTGTLAAQGPAGTGGQIETSGETLSIGAASIDTHGGSWLLDPDNLIIDSTSANAIDTALKTGNVTLATSASGAPTETGVAGATNDITVGAGDIIVQSALAWSSATTLTLNAYNGLYIDAPITVSGAGKVALTYAPAGPGLTFAPGDALQFTGTAGGGQALTINGQAYTLLYSVANSGSTTTDSGLTDLAGIDNNTAAGADAGDYALARSVTAPSSTFTTALVGAAMKGFSGTLEGLGNTITGLTISAPGVGDIGLIGTLADGLVRDLGLAGGMVLGADYVGGLVGRNAGGTVETSYATGAVSGNLGVGGLVGDNVVGTIEASYATGAVSGGEIGGLSEVGGLVGSSDGGTIETSYATGAVSGTGAEVGGLVGVSAAGGTIETSYATGAASANSYVGGLVGASGGTVKTSYATGVVSGVSDIGGLVGSNGANSTVSSSYFDTQTTGRSVGIGVDQNNQSAGAAGLTTAQLQSDAGGYMTNLGAAFGGGTGGFYPYLATFFPNGVQVVTGTAYGDGGGAPLAGTTVGVIGNGAAFGTVSSGADGYFYAFAPAGTLTSGKTLLAYDPDNAATLATTTGATIQNGVNLYGNTVTVSTASTTLSGAPTLAQARTAATAADGGVAAVASLIAGATGLGLDASGASFTVNQVVSTPGLVIITQSGDPLTVAATITLTGAGALGLDSGGALAIDAPIVVAGGGQAALGYGAGGLSFDLTSAGFGGSLSFAVGAGEGVTGQGLTIDGTRYTLLYSMTDVAGLNGKSGDYALAAPITATGTYTSAVATSFSGTLEGLGETITGLTISAPGVNDVGLIGVLGGTVRDIGIVGGSVSGSTYVGGLIGLNFGGTVETSYATGAVSGSNYVGGLVGLSGGTVETSYATGAVSGGSDVGGLVGLNDGGTVETSYATGAVSGTGEEVGGLVGRSYGGGTIETSYATGAVSGSAYAVGGLVGENEISTVETSYATGAVSGAEEIGGLIGLNDAKSIVSNSYFDTQTTGRSTGIGVDQNDQSTGVTGLTTAQLQSDAGGYMSNLGTDFAGGTGGLYPYLTTFFPGGVQVVTGTIYSDGGGAPLAGTTVGVIGNDSVVFGTVSSGANGYFYAFAAAGTLASGQTLLAYDTADAATLTTATGATLQTGVKLYGNTVTVPTAATTLSTAPTLAQAQASATAADGGVAAAAAAIAGATGLGLNATGASFTVNQAVSSGLVIFTQSGDPLTVADAITLTGTGALGLDSGGALAIDAPIDVSGGSQVALSYGAGGLSFDLTSAGFGGSLSYAVGTGEGIAGQALTLNGTSYTLLYSMTDVAGINGKSGHYALAAPISATTSYTGAVVGSFSGTLEGLGNSLSGLTISGGGASKVGLIGTLNTGGVVRDLGVAGGSVSGLSEVGGLVGLSYGTVADTIVSDTARSSASGDFTGGLVGDNAAGATISASYASGTVTGGAEYAGGLVGFNDGGISSASASGAVSAASGDYLGGLVGENAAGGTITNATASGMVTGADDIGGLIGYNIGAIGHVGATGAVSAANGLYVGGLVGYNVAGATIATATASGATVSASGADDVGGLVGFNRGTITGSSASDAVVGGGGGFAAGGLVGDNGSGAKISSSFSSGTVTGGAEYAGGLAGYNYGAISSDYTSGGAVGSASGIYVGGLVGENAATGTITDANTSGATVSADGVAVGGLVGFNRGSITGSSAYDPVDNGASGVGTGGLVGDNGSGAKIASSYARGTVSGGEDYTGGLVGYNYGAIGSGSSASGAVSASSNSYLGGLVGENAAGGTITGATASGTVTGADDIGGLVGYNAGAISGASGATGNVSAANGKYVGGLVGYNAAGGTITAATTSGATVSASGADDVGGLVGFNRGGVTGSSAADKVVGGGSGFATGGLVGDNGSGATIASSFATGAVTGGSEYTGGLAGYNYGAVSNAYAYSGAITGGSYVGGLVGDNGAGGTVSTSWSSGAVSGTTDIGGSIGLQSGTASDVYWDAGTSGKTVGVGSGASTGLTGIGGATGRGPDAQATYAGFNFSTVWTINAGTSRAFLKTPAPATPPN